MKLAPLYFIALFCTIVSFTGCGGSDENHATKDSVLQSGSVKRLSASHAATTPVAASVLSLIKVSEKRIGRTTFEYVFKVNIRNGSTPQVGLHAKLLSAGTGTTMIDGDVDAGNVGADSTVTPADTITLRQDRLFPLLIAQLVWQFSAQGTGGAPASIRLDINQLVVGAGETLTARPVVLDESGSALVPQPSLSYHVLAPISGASGTTPSVSGNEIRTSPDTRGGFSLQATVTGSAVTASISFAVVPPTSVSANSGLYVTQAAAQSALSEQLAILKAALDRRDNVAAAAAQAAIASAASSVDLNDLAISTAFAPASGFFPLPDKLIAKGINPTTADSIHQNRTDQLRVKIQQITALLQRAGRLGPADIATLSQYAGELESLVTTLTSPGNEPSVFGVVQSAQQVHALLAKDMPILLKAIATRSGSELAFATEQAKTDRLPAPPQLNVGIGNLIEKMGPIGQLVKKVYGQYIKGVENAVALLEFGHLLDTYLTTNLTINGIKTGPSVSFNVYNYPNSYIDTSGISVESARNADVFLVGNAAIDAMRNLSIPTRPPHDLRSFKEVYNYFKSVYDSVKSVGGVGQQFQSMFQPPADAIASNFSEFGGCFPSYGLGLDDCVEMLYPSGFKNVAGNSPVGFVVLILVRSGGPQPEYDSLIVSIAPGT